MAKKDNRLTEKQLGRFYKLMSSGMVDFDCGKMCAPDNDGIPFCCDHTNCVPVLFKTEYQWQNKKADFWKKAPIKTKAERKMVAESVDYYVFCKCPGVAKCDRNLRALICRAFPFEPHVDGKGKVQGLAFQDERNKGCSLVGMPRKSFNDQYVKNAMIFWQELIDIFPEERDLYIEESRRREKRFKRRSKPLRLFR